MPELWAVTADDVKEVLNAMDEPTIESSYETLEDVLIGLYPAQVIALNHQLRSQGLPDVSVEFYSLRNTPTLLTAGRISRVSLQFDVNKKDNKELFTSVWKDVKGAASSMKFDRKVNALGISFSVPNISL